MDSNASVNKKFVPDISSELRQDIVKSPDVIKNASGIRLFGKRIKSIIYTMDVAVIANSNA
ncbi:MAG: hydrolase, partial [Lentilactobacillus hilgardii]